MEGDYGTRVEGASLQQYHHLCPLPPCPPLGSLHPCPPLSQCPRPPGLAASNINSLLSSLPAIQGPAKLGTGIKIV